MAGTNILLFDESKSNMLSDSAYAEAGQRTDGVQQGIASSQLQNKFQYQMSLIAYSIALIMVDNGKDANDADEVATFVSNLSDTLVQKVADKANEVEAKAGTNDSKFVTPAMVKAYVDNIIATQSDAEGGTDNTKMMTPLRVKQAIDKFAPGGGGGGGISASWDGETLVLEEVTPPNEGE